MLHLIKLSRHINPRQGFAIHPQFGSNIWTLILTRVEQIDEVLLFCNSRWTGNRKSFDASEKRTSRIAALGRMEWLSDKQFAELRDRSNEGGHLSVLYKIPCDSSLVPRLINLWTTPRTVSDTARDDLGLKRDETNELAAFVHLNEATHIVAAFAQNAEPLYLFGARDQLANILNRANEK